MSLVTQRTVLGDLPKDRTNLGEKRKIGLSKRKLESCVCLAVVTELVHCLGQGSFRSLCLEACAAWAEDRPSSPDKWVSVSPLPARCT